MFNATEFGGGSFDADSGILYLSLQKAAREQGQYANPPLILAYRLNSANSTGKTTTLGKLGKRSVLCVEYSNQNLARIDRGSKQGSNISVKQAIKKIKKALRKKRLKIRNAQSNSKRQKQRSKKKTIQATLKSAKQCQNNTIDFD